MRLFKNKYLDCINFIGTGYHENNTIGIFHGKYNNNKLIDEIEIKPGFNITSTCEKNWIYTYYKDEIHIVYSWYPLKICKINKENNSILDLVIEKPMPKMFRSTRGSTCGFKYNNEIWFIVHIVSYEKPRHYYHVMVIFDENMNLQRYSAPFKFEDECIEYCLGVVVENKQVIMTYSTLDKTTKLAIYDKEYIDSILIYI
jgi:hypothetical protein